MRGVDRPLLILYISVAKTWRFRSWIETEPPFCYKSLNDDCLSLYVVLRHLSWSRFIFLLFSRLWDIHIDGQKLNCVLKKEFISKHRFNKFIKGVTLASACIFLHIFYTYFSTQCVYFSTAVLHRSVICGSNLSLESNLTPKSFFTVAVFCFKVVYH